jgi:hypothetical protein
MKNLVGKKVYLRPVGNTFLNNSNIVIAKIGKVTTDFVTFVKCDSGVVDTLRFKGMHLTDDCNYGYVVYETLKDLEDYKEVCRLSKLIFDNYRYRSDYKKLSLEKILKIVEILGLNGGEK